ncbi:hypothetical protein AXK11_08390 [Cephaloticoccus primus]|uniref:Uncharacterized protein n=1 Tax=Cephaloticoccus primus TaxID=1548207 RepID=A0A139SIW2_9BACT|nr:SEL1-like repeat protein [Cephaloticoccus primus]KXU34476.1 hypothetical protein AXK11_08390 [Cephaloticoccus primus]
MSSRRLILSSCLFGFLLLLAVTLIVPSRAQQQPANVAALQERANAGDPEALFLLGTLYESGQVGGRADPAKAAELYRRAADLGLPHAQFNLGNMYAAGHGVTADPFESIMWLRRAADAGLPEAQFNLAVAYEQGHGVRADLATARRWYEAAAKQDYPEAQYNLAMMYEDGHGVAQDDRRAAELYLAAARQGYGPAQNNYGIMLAEGRGGLAANLVDAYAWLSLASEESGRTQGRDLVAQHLNNEQRAAATRRLAQLKGELSGEPAAVPAIAPSEAAGVQVASLNEPSPSATAAVAAATPVATVAQAKPASAATRTPTDPRPPPAPGTPAARVAADRQAKQVQAPMPVVSTKRPSYLPPAKNSPAAPTPTVAQKPAPASTPAPEARASVPTAAPSSTSRPASASRPAVVSGAAPATANIAAATQEKVRELEAANKALNEEVKRSTLQLGVLHRELNAAKDALAKGASPAAGQGGAELVELRKKFDELSAANAKLTAENRELAQRASAAKETKGKPASSRQGASLRDVARLEAENAALRRDLESATRALTALQLDMKSARPGAAAAPSQKENRAAIAAAVDREAAKYKRRIESLTADSERLVAENRELSQKLQTATTALSSAPASYELQRLEEANAALTEEVKRAKHAAALARDQAESRVTGASSETARLKRQLEELRANSDRLAAQNRDLADQVQSAKLALASTVPAAELRSLESEKSVLRAEIDRLKGERSQAESRVAATSDEKNRLSRELADLRGTNQRLASEVQELRQKSQSAAMNLASSVPANEFKQLQAKNASLNDQLSRATSDLDTLRREFREAQAATETKVQLAVAAAVDKEAAKHRRDIEQINANNERLLAANRELSAKAQTGDTASIQRVQLLEAEKTRLNTELRRVEQERDQIQSRASSAMLAIADHQHKTEELVTANSRLTAQVRDLEGQVQAAKLAASGASSSGADLRRLESEKSALAAEKATLVAQLNRAESEKNALASEKASVAGQLSRLESERNALASEKATLVAELGRLKNADSQSSQLARQFEELRSNSEKLVAKNRELESQLNMARQAVSMTVPVADFKRLETQNATLTAELSRSQQSLDALRLELSQVTTAQATHAREVRSQIARAVETETAQTRRQLDELLANTQRLTAQNRDLTAQNRDLSNQVETLRQNLASAVPADRLKQLETEKALAQAELERARNEGALQLRIAEAKASKVQSEFAQLSARVDELAAAREQLVNDNRALANQVQLAQLNLAASVPADEVKRLESEKAIAEANLRRAQLEHQQTQARLAEVANSATEHARQLDDLRNTSLRLSEENRDLSQRLHAQELALAAAVPQETVKKLESEKALLTASLERAKREHELYRQLSEARAAAAQAATALATHHRETPVVDASRAQLIDDLRAQNAALKAQNERLSSMALDMANRRVGEASSIATRAGAGDSEALRLRVLELERQLLQERVNTARN